MNFDVSQTATAVMPYATAVVAAYGKDTLDKIRNTVTGHASNATVNLGHRLLARILRRDQSREVVAGALVDLANGEEDGQAALRLQIRKALSADPELAREVAEMLSVASYNEASGQQAIAVGNNYGIASSGSNSMNIGAQHNHGSGTFIGRDHYESAIAPNEVQS